MQGFSRVELLPSVFQLNHGHTNSQAVKLCCFDLRLVPALQLPPDKKDQLEGQTAILWIIGSLGEVLIGRWQMHGHGPAIEPPGLREAEVLSTASTLPPCVLCAARAVRRRWFAVLRFALQGQLRRLCGHRSAALAGAPELGAAQAAAAPVAERRTRQRDRAAVRAGLAGRRKYGKRAPAKRAVAGRGGLQRHGSGQAGAEAISA